MQAHSIATTPSPELHEIIGRLDLTREVDHAWHGLKDTLFCLCRELGAHQVLEIGGGRHPFLSVADAEALGIELTVNDIDAAELHFAPAGLRRLVFDISGSIDHIAAAQNSFDLIFSRMVFEHVPDAPRAWSNVYRMLRPGGVGFAFVPTLFSPPFVLNRLIPEAISSRLVRALDGSRNPQEVPKFPAYYHYCRASESALRPMLQDIGFRELVVQPFYGTPYFPRIPVLRTLARAIDVVAERQDWRGLASYAYIMVRK